jgi:hypothetical protein
LAKIPSESKMLGWRQTPLDDVAYVLLVISPVAPGRSHSEISSRFAPREFGPAPSTSNEAGPQTGKARQALRSLITLGMALPL